MKFAQEASEEVIGKRGKERRTRRSEESGLIFAIITFVIDDLSNEGGASIPGLLTSFPHFLPHLMICLMLILSL